MIKAPKKLMSENRVYLYNYKQKQKKGEGGGGEKKHTSKVFNYFILV